MLYIVHILKEFLELLHLLRVGHETVHGVAHALNPKKHEQVNTTYDAAEINTIKTDAETYLTQLTGCVNHLESAKAYLLKIKDVTEELPNVPTNSHRLSSILTEFMGHLHSANWHINQFLLTLTPPPRQCLYRANSLAGINTIERYNNSLKAIKQFITDIYLLKQKINEQFQAFYTDLSTTPDAEETQHIRESIHQCINESMSLETILPENKELATICKEIIRTHKEFKDLYLKEQPEPWENDPNWFPLLRKEEQLERGQRIFLHAMNETNFSEKEKLLFAELFLRKSVSNQLIKQVEVELKAYQMAGILRNWQIGKCEQMIRFLQKIQQDTRVPSDDPDRLLAWLTTDRKKHTSIDWLKGILVSPFCFSTRSLDEVLNILKEHMTIKEKPEILLREYEHIHWAKVWEKSDELIQFPKFQTEILPSARLQPDDPSPLNVVSPGIQKLAMALHKEIIELKEVLQTNKMSYNDEITSCAIKEQKALRDKKKQKHELGVARTKLAEGHIHACTSASSSLYPYLYDADASNEEVQKSKVPTPEDLLQIIYQGINPNEVCFWDIESQQLSKYFCPNKPKDTRIRAWMYALTICQVNMLPLLTHLFPTQDTLLIEDSPPPESQSVINNLSLQAILQHDIPLTTHSTSLNGLAPKQVEETNSIFQQLYDYHVLALVRVKPEYRKTLPYMKQIECLFKNFFKLTPSIGEERLKSVQLFIGNFCTVISAKDVASIRDAVSKLENNVKDNKEKAQRTYSSELYRLMDKAINGPLLEIKTRNKGLLETENHKLEENEKLKKERREDRKIINEQDAALSEQDAALSEKDAALSEKDAALSEKDAALSEKDELLAKVRQEKDELLAKVRQEKEVLMAKLKQMELQLSAAQGTAEAPPIVLDSSVRFFSTPTSSDGSDASNAATKPSVAHENHYA